MATPHSFTFSPAVQQSLAPTSRRNSASSTQLPLPSSLSPQHQQQQPRTPPPAPSSPRAFTFSNPRPADSPVLASFSYAPHPHSSSTHAGGIQPPAAFFRPSKPIHQPQYSRPASPSSIIHVPADTHDTDHFPLGPISAGYSTDEHHAAESVHEPHPPQQFSSLKRIKQSREPLLPTSSSASRPSISVTSATPMSPSRLVRNSLDRVLSISRGLSFDSIRRSASAQREDAFETKLSDEENGYSPTAQYAGNSKHHFPAQSLDVRNSHHSGVHSHSPSHSHSHSNSHSHSASPAPSFIPTPPIRRPPLSAVPLLSPTTHKPVRRYEQHPSRNRFYLRGRILTGGDTPWAFVVAFGTLLTIAGVWFGTTAVWWWHNESPAVAGVAVYMALLTISSMLTTATTDPGILPRNLDPDPPYPATSPSDGGIRAPMPRDLKVRSDIVRVKYCPTCKTYRPPRSSHCKMTTTLLLIILTSALHLYFVTRREHIDLAHALRTAQGVGSAVAFALSVCVIWPVGALLSYHMRLLLLNITTIEQIRNQAHKTLIPGPPPPNPFSHGSWKRNLLAVLCRPQGFSWLDAAAPVTEDKREVNPGLLEGEGMDGEEGEEEGRSHSGHGHGHVAGGR
uniref:protein S-acyltransferase n=1 Tax=Psilocybe cubensis TaxID=181762 RepID=A0A8H7Y158_PSICU